MTITGIKQNLIQARDSIKDLWDKLSGSKELTPVEGTNKMSRKFVTSEDNFVMRTNLEGLGAEVGITSTGAVAMSTTETGKFSMFGTYKKNEVTINTSEDLGAQITTRQGVTGAGSRILVTMQKAYYKAFATDNSVTDENEIVTRKDLIDSFQISSVTKDTTDPSKYTINGIALSGDKIYLVKNGIVEGIPIVTATDNTWVLTANVIVGDIYHLVREINGDTTVNYSILAEKVIKFN